MDAPLEHLKWSVQALALPSREQRTLFPPFVCIADELALDFEQWLQTAAGQHEFSAEQRTALTSLDDVLSAMSGADQAELWIDEALDSSGEWENVRERARGTLTVFGWPLE